MNNAKHFSSYTMWLGPLKDEPLSGVEGGGGMTVINFAGVTVYPIPKSSNGKNNTPYDSFD